MQSEYEFRKHVRKYSTAEWHRNRPIDYNRAFKNAYKGMRAKLIAQGEEQTSFLRYFDLPTKGEK